jgi:hypothetical protein
MSEKTLTEQLADDTELLRRRHVHATRPRGPLSMDQAADLAARMSGDRAAPAGKAHRCDVT